MSSITNPFLIGNTVEKESQKQVFRLIRQIEWHINKIKRDNYNLMDEDIKDLEKIEEMFDVIAPFDEDKIWRGAHV